MSELRRLGQYELHEMIGRGGMGVVYRAFQPAMHRQVAIKLISTNLPNRDEFVDRFQREAAIAAQLRHPHILPVFDFGREGEIVYLVMQLVEGDSLEGLLKRGALPLDQATRMFSQIASAIGYAHRRGVVHRDLKPSNILIDEENNTYLTDFGIARQVSSVTITRSGMFVGTPEYVAPEVWQGERATALSDIYALGCVLFQMLTGKLPFESTSPYGMMYKHVNELPPSPLNIQHNLPDGLTTVIRKALAKNPAERYATAEEMARDFEAAVRGELRGERPTPHTPTTADINLTLVGVPGADQPAKRRSPALLLIPIIAVLLIGGGVILSQSGRGVTTPTPQAQTGSTATDAAMAQAALPTGSTLTHTATYTPPPPTATLLTATRTARSSETPEPTIATRATTAVAALAATDTPRPTPTPTATATFTDIPTATPSTTPSLTPSPTPSATASATATPSHTASATLTATATPTYTATFTATFSPTPTATPTEPPTPTAIEPPTPTLIPTETPAIMPTVNRVAMETGQMSYGDVVEGSIDSQRPAQFWRFNGGVGDRLLIAVRVTSGSLLPVVRILDSGGRYVDWNDNGGVLSSIPLPADGEYTVYVSRRNLENGNTVGSYELSLTLLEAGIRPTPTPSETPTLTPTLTPSVTLTLTPSPTPVRSLLYGLEVAGFLLSTDTVDTWNFRGQPDDEIAIRASDASGDPLRLSVFGPGLPTDGRTGQNAITGLRLENGGDFSIAITGGRGPYTLTVSRAAEAATPAPAGFMKYGDAVRVAVNLNTPEQERSFVGVQDEIVSISATGDGAIDPVLELIGPDGALLAKNDDTAGSEAAAISRLRLPSSGVFRIRVSRYPGRVSGGTVTIRLARNAPEVPSLAVYPPAVLRAGEERILNYGDTINGRLESSQSERFVFFGRRGEPIRISMQRKSDSDTLDPAMTLVDNSTNETLYNSGRSTSGDRSEFITETLPNSGKYTLTISPMAFYPTSGDYRLELRLVDPRLLLLPGRPQPGVLDDARPQQVFEFDGIAGAYVRLAARPANNSRFDPLIFVLAPNGRMIAFHDSASQTESPAIIEGLRLAETGRYSVVVTRPGGETGTSVGTYILALEVMDTPAPDWQNPPVFRYGGGVVGEFGEGGSETWRFTGASGDVINLKLSRLMGDGAASVQELIGPDGGVVTQMGQTEDPKGAQVVSYHLRADGEYAVRVAGERIQYALTAELVRNIPIIADELTYNGPEVVSYLVPGSKITFRFNGKTADQLDLSVFWRPSTDRPVIVNLIDPSGSSERLPSPVSNTSASTRRTLTTTGVYQIEIISQAIVDIQYTIRLRGTTPPPTATPFTTFLSSGQIITDELLPVEGKLYKFLGRPSQSVRITVEMQRGASPTLALTGPNGDPVQANVVDATGYAALDAALPGPGEYTILLAASGDEDFGPYRLKFALVENTAPPTPTIEATVGPDQAQAGAQIAYNLPVAGRVGAGETQVYGFDGRAGEIALISLFMPTSGDIPPPGPSPTPGARVPVYATLTVYGPDLAYLAESTSSGANDRTQPALRLELPATGRYTIVVRGRGGAGARAADYQLSVVGIPPGATATPNPPNFLPFEEVQKTALQPGQDSVVWRYIPGAETLLLVVRPDPESGLKASAEVYTREGFLEAAQTAANPGDELRVLVNKLSSRDDYQIVIRALDGTSGPYTMYAAGSPGGLVVFSTRRLAFVRNGPSTRATYFTQIFGDNFEAFARSADGAWVKIRDAGTKRYGWVGVSQISAVTYGSIDKLPVEEQ